MDLRTEPIRIETTWKVVFNLLFKKTGSHYMGNGSGGVEGNGMQKHEIVDLYHENFMQR